MNTNTNTTSWLIALLLSLIVLVFVVPVVSFAQAPETGVGAGGLVTCSGSYCNFCELIQTGNGILNWLFGIIFVIFAVLVFISGFKMVTAGMSGNYNSLGDTKKTLTNAIIGIIIIFAAWLIVDTLMKGIANGGQLTGLGMWNSIDDVNCGSQMVPQQGTGLAEQGPTGGVTPVTASAGCRDLGNGTQECGARTISLLEQPRQGEVCTPIQGNANSDRQRCVTIEPLGGVPATGGGGDGCPTCVQVTRQTIPMNANPCVGHANGCYIHPDMLGRLEGMGGTFRDQWQVSEAYPPTVTHRSTCHSDATCIDVSWQGSGEPTAQQIIAMTNSARSNNLTVEYEVPNQAAANTLIAAGVTNVIVVAEVAPHFSVYMCDQTSNNACNRAGGG